MESWGLGPAGLAGNFLEGVEPLPFAGGAWGVPPCLEPLVDGPQKLGPLARGQGGVLLATHLQLVVESLQEAVTEHITNPLTLDSVQHTDSNVL